MSAACAGDRRRYLGRTDIYARKSRAVTRVGEGYSARLRITGCERSGATTRQRRGYKKKGMKISLGDFMYRIYVYTKKTLKESKGTS